MDGLAPLPAVVVEDAHLEPLFAGFMCAVFWKVCVLLESSALKCLLACLAQEERGNENAFFHAIVCAFVAGMMVFLFLP
jgi:hypothetical protein